MLESGLDEEIRFHIDQQTEKNLRAGMAPSEARRQALIRFGGLEAVKEGTRDEFRSPILENVLRDLRHGARSLRRAPGFTILAGLTLAIGIGASTAVFSVVNGVLLRPLPYPAPEALVGAQTTISATQFFTYRDENRTLEAFGVWARGTANVTGLAEPEQVGTLRVTHGALQAVGVSPVIGRWFSQQDDSPGFPESVILANGYWQRRFGSDRSVIGRTLTVDSRPRIVLGVMPAGFRFLNEKADLIMPFQFQRGGLVLGAFNYFAIARLKPGVTLAQANADIARMRPVWLRSWPSPPGFDATMFEERSHSLPALRPLRESVVGNIGEMLWFLMGTIGIVLLIACANVANLLLVRAEGRQQELAVRAALGAGWRRIAHASFLENLVLALLGGVWGLGLAFAALRLLVKLEPENLPRLTEITIDSTVLLFCLGVSFVSGLLVGLVPVVRHAHGNTAAGLRGGGRTATGSRERHWTRNTLVIIQIGLALVLLVSSGLMTRTFVALRSVKPGFAEADQVQLARITIPRTLLDDPERVFGLQSEIRDRMAAIPGVAAVAFTSAAPMEPFISANTVFVEDRSAEGAGPPTHRFKFVSPGLFRTVGTTLLAGRDFTWAEVAQRGPVAVISEGMARDAWREPAAALGKRIREAPTAPWREIVGVVEGVLDDGLHAPAPLTVYWPAIMNDFEGERIRIRRSMTFAIRTSRAGSEGLLKDMQHAVRAAHPNLPVAQIQTLGAIYERSLAPASFTLVMLAIAAGMALLLGLVGIYCVTAHAVTQRTREIGIRTALGAQPGELERLFVRQGVALACVGVVCGLASAAGVTRLMSSLLYGIRPLDPLTYIVVSVVLIAAAGIASYVPAHRATTVDPVEALRAE